jgi:hypothetical protein
MTTESPRRKARPSPIQVPLSPSRASGIERPIATSTGIISARRKLSLDPAPLTGAPGIIGSEARRKRNSNSHLPPPKSAAANFAQQRGISTVTVRTTLPLSPHTGNDASPSPKTGSSHAVSAVSAKSTEERGLGSPLKTSGLRTSRTVEVDYLRNEMEKAMRMAGAETTEPDAEVRKDSELRATSLVAVCVLRMLTNSLPACFIVILCKFYHTPGLTCTSRPCRFVHEFDPGSPIPTPQTASLAKAIGGSTDVVELVEQFPMSGGGSGPGSKHSKEKYRTVKCRDWDARGECPYGEFCSFLHDVKPAPAEHGEDKSSLKTAERPGLTTENSTTSLNGSRPKSFNGSNIIVPDLRWTRDDGLTVSNPATGTKPDFRDIAGKLVETISESLSTKLEGLRVSDEAPSPATQYASIPPRSAWQLGPPRMLAPNSAVQGVSPDLPISAYTFSTDSPGTPYHHVDDDAEEAEARASDSDGPEEAVEPSRPEQPTDHIRIHEPSNDAVRTDYANEPHLVLPPYIQPVHDFGAYPWPIERLYPQAVSATWDAILKDPSKVGPQGKDLEQEARKLVAQKLARMVKGGKLPPQEVQAKMNYRSESEGLHHSTV